MENKTAKSGSNKTRRAFIKSTGILLGSAALKGKGFASYPVIAESKESGIQENKSWKSNLIDIHVHTCFQRLPKVTRDTGTKYPTPEELINKMNSEGITKAVVLCGVSPEFGFRFMEEFQDRLYFGTDLAYIPQELPQVPYFRKLKEQKLISEAAYEKIAWKNANNLLL